MDFDDDCISCDDRVCYRGVDCTSIAGEAEEKLKDEDTRRMLVAAGAIEAEGYGKLTRVQELIEFLRRMGFRKIGVAFCIGLADEAGVLDAILKKQGFDVASVCCKICGISKDGLGIRRLHADWDDEATCNPVGQALALGEAGTDINVLVGLCMGHDVLFNKYSHAPVTTLIVKDRVLAHNPAGALYSGYQRKKLLK